jgi:hypothetical protein
MNRAGIIFFSIVLLILSFADAVAQENPDPAGAFWRSIAVPGWGHYYTDQENWNRGKAHLGAEIVLIGSFFGIHSRANRLENQFITLSGLKAGVDISGRDRTFRLAIGDFDTLEEYNDYQLRSRNWNRLIADTPENRWEWDSAEDRRRYRELRSGSDRLRNQLPALAGLMVVNRVISGISAFTKARGITVSPELSLLPVHTGERKNGVVARLSIRF